MRASSFLKDPLPLQHELLIWVQEFTMWVPSLCCWAEPSWPWQLWKTISQGGCGSIPGAKSLPRLAAGLQRLCDGPLAGADVLQEQGWLWRTALPSLLTASPRLQLLSPPPLFNCTVTFLACLFSVFSLTVAFYNCEFFSPSLLLPVLALRRWARKCIRWGLPWPVAYIILRRMVCICLAFINRCSLTEFLLLLVFSFPKLSA